MRRHLVAKALPQLCLHLLPKHLLELKICGSTHTLTCSNTSKWCPTPTGKSTRSTALSLKNSLKKLVARYSISMDRSLRTTTSSALTQLPPLSRPSAWQVAMSTFRWSKIHQHLPSRSTLIWTWRNGATVSGSLARTYTKRWQPRTASSSNFPSTWTTTGGPSSCSTCTPFSKNQASCQAAIWLRAPTRSSRLWCVPRAQSEAFTLVITCTILLLCHRIWGLNLLLRLTGGPSSSHGLSCLRIYRRKVLVNLVKAK